MSNDIELPKEIAETIGKIITGVSEMIEKKENQIIKEMVEVMMKQRTVIRKAAVMGIKVDDLMDEIKKEYERQVEELKK